MIKLFLLLTALLISPAVFCQEKIETDRPDQTESPYTTPKKWLQFEAGFNYQKNGDHENEYLHPTLLSKYGITKNLELRLITTLKTNSYLVIPAGTINESGLDPVELGFKLGLFEEKGVIPKTSFIFHLAIPGLASEKFDIDKAAPNFRFTMQHSLSKNISLGYNIGAGWDGVSSKIAEFIYTFAPGFNLSEKWYGYIEAFGSLHPDSPPEHNLDGGIAYFINNDFKIDLSAGVGISEAAPSHYFSLGASIRFKTTRK